MKFLIKKELEYTTLLKHLIVALSMALSLYLLLDIVLHGFFLGTDTISIAHTLYGNEAEYTEPIPLDSLLLQIHIDLFMSLVSFMLISSIYIRYFSHRTYTKILVHLLFVTGLLAPLSILIAYFTSPILIYIWLGSFLLSHIVAIFMSLKTIKKLLTL